jgi:predicted Abi (CAAX) family protease
VRVLLVSLLFPALTEELLFRVLPLPRIGENVPPVTMGLWGATSLALFVASHQIKASWTRSRYVFRDPVFLLLTAFLGLACTITYLRSSSIWPAVAIHWLCVIVWLLALGGYRRLNESISPGT